MIRGTAVITVAALTNGAEETYTINTRGTGSQNTVQLYDRGNTSGGLTTAPNWLPDVIVINPMISSTYQPEAGWQISSAWVDSPGVIKFIGKNIKASGTLSGGTLVVSWAAIR